MLEYAFPRFKGEIQAIKAGVFLLKFVDYA
jgi:hypothetical protein